VSRPQENNNNNNTERERETNWFEMPIKIKTGLTPSGVRCSDDGGRWRNPQVRLSCWRKNR
jgi:hypothetical protein